MTVNIQVLAFTLRTLFLAVILGLLAFFGYPVLAAPVDQAQLTVVVIVSVVLTSLLHLLLFRLGLRSTTLYVGNLAFKTTENELFELFSQFGAINSIRIMKDRITRRPRGYAFVELSTASARAAIKDLNGHEFGGRTLKVNVANKRGRQQDV